MPEISGWEKSRSLGQKCSEGLLALPSECRQTGRRCRAVHCLICSIGCEEITLSRYSPAEVTPFRIVVYGLVPVFKFSLGVISGGGYLQESYLVDSFDFASAWANSVPDSLYGTKFDDQWAIVLLDRTSASASHKPAILRCTPPRGGGTTAPWPWLTFLESPRRADVKL